MQLKRILCLILISSFTFQISSFALDSELHGFVDARAGLRTQDDPNEDERNLTEARLQLDALTYFDWGELQIRSDVLYDDLADNLETVDLENGNGFVDLREFNLLFSPVDWADLKVGRQILTWGTGDLLFINDLFPKDWNSFLLGRDEEYLKAPSDAVYASFFPAFASIDIAYMPNMDADRYIDGRRVSYWNPMLQQTAGQQAEIDAERRDEWFKEDEISARVYRPFLNYQAALYGYHGFWKSPVGLRPSGAYFPRLNVYGASLEGTIGEGIAHLEAGYYDSREERSSTHAVPDDESRFLIGYQREVAQNLTASGQYYVERSTNKDRHVLTLRLTQMWMNQNLILSLFTFYSPTDKDAYFRPNATYKVNDHWKITAGGNILIGEDRNTFFGQFQDNSNVNLGARYNF